MYQRIPGGKRRHLNRTHLPLARQISGESAADPVVPVATSV